VSWNLKSTPYSPLGQFLSDFNVGCANKITYRNFYFLFLLGIYLFSYLRKHFKQIKIQTAPAIYKTNWELGIGYWGYGNRNSNPIWVVVPLSESYVNRGDQRKPEAAAENQWMRMRLGTGYWELEMGMRRSNRERSETIQRLMQTLPVSWLDWLTDWLTYWHMMFGMSVVFDLPFALCRKRCRCPTKWKSRTVSMSIQAIYQSCLEIRQPIDSVQQSVRHSVSVSSFSVAVAVAVFQNCL